MTVTVDFLVVGGGIAGAAAAFELSAHGSVVLLERESVAGYHTTGRSAALYTEAWEKGIWRGLAIASRGFLENPPPDFADFPLLSSLPVLIVGREDQRQLVEGVAADASRDLEMRLIGEAEALDVCPVLRPGYVSQAILETGSRAIDVDALHQGYLRGARRRGAIVELGRKAEVTQRTQGEWRIVAGQYEYRSAIVVNAAGAWCDEVAQQAGVAPVGLVPKRRTAFTFGAPADIDLGTMPMVIDVAEQFYFKPEVGQFMGSLAEATPMEPHDVRPEEIDVARAIERIEAATTLEIRHVRRAWAGLRSFVADELPVVGEDPDGRGFFWLAGQGGAGIMTSSALARLVTGLIVDGTVPRDLSDLGLRPEQLAPSRFPLTQPAPARAKPDRTPTTR
jgi:D-arginine dehydrogenase